jgi:23S rRNA (adenine2503-C2)-methyltransferase
VAERNPTPPAAPSDAAPPRPLSAQTAAEMEALLKKLGEPAFRVTQLREFIYRRGIASLDEVTNLKKTLRAELAANAPLYDLQFVETTEGDDALKWLWRAPDGALVESVQIRVPDRLTSCLSSQVGCAMGCVFCATGRDGYERNLRSHEIVEQYLQMWGRSKEHSSHVVFMGMGEPLHNYDEVLDAIRVLNAPSPKGAGIGARRITLSTVGLVPGIRKLANEQLQLELAISLHAPDDATRRQLIPAARRYPIAEVMDAVREFIQKTRRMVTFEYVLLAGVNDSEEQARELGGLLQELPCKVNLIPYNPVEGVIYQRPVIEDQERFRSTIERFHLTVTIRNSKGRSASAACGQLRHKRRT